MKKGEKTIFKRITAFVLCFSLMCGMLGNLTAVYAQYPNNGFMSFFIPEKYRNGIGTMYTNTDTSGYTKIPTVKEVMPESTLIDVPTGYHWAWYFGWKDVDFNWIEPAIVEFGGAMSGLLAYLDEIYERNKDKVSIYGVRFELYLKGNDYTVTYNANGGSGTMSNSSHRYDKEKNLTANSFTRTGYTFSGWNTKADGTGTSYADKASVKNLTSTDDGNVILYAQWTTNVYTVTLDNQGAVSAGTTAYYSNYGNANYKDVNCTEVISSITRPTKTGYTFGGYYTGKNGTGTQYINASGSILSTGTSFAANTTLYAYWIGSSYKLSYYPNGGTGNIITETYAYGSAYTVKGTATYTRPGYTFIGWNDKADGSGTSYTAGSSKTWETGGDMSLYAQWKPNVYRITLDNQSAGTAGTANFYIKYDTGIFSSSSCTTEISSITVPVKTGYTFGGYYTEKNGKGEQYVDSSGSIVCSDTIVFKNTTLYTHWIPKKYAIKYDANGGSGTMEDSSAVFGESVTLHENLFTRTGYTFKGWSTTADGSVEYKNNETIGSFSAEGSSLKLYAVWECEVYKITLDGSNGTVEFYVKYNTGIYTDKDCSQSISSITVPTKTGYTFVGYYTGQNGAGSCYVNSTGTISAGKTAFTSDITLYPLWRVNKYTIRYDANGGSGTMADTAAVYGTSINLTENAYTRTGYAFKGWSTTANGSVAYSNRQSVLNLTEEAGKTIILYAVWEEKIYTITLDSQGAENSGTTVYYQKYGNGLYSDAGCTRAVSSITVPTKTCYTFRGYYTGTGGTGTCYINASGTITAEKTAFTADTKLYAYWTVNSYTIKYHANGGSGTMADTPASYGTSVNLAKNQFTRTGYLFKGWSSSANGSAVYTDGQAVISLTAENGGTVDLYAVWAVNSYTVSYNANGETTGAVISKTYAYGAAVDLSITAAKPGYTFVGWSTSKTAGIPLSSYTMPDKNVTLYAVYTIQVSDVENHEYPSYSETADIADDEVYLMVWIKGNASVCRTYPLNYKEDASQMVYRYELPQTDIASFVNGREFYYQLIAYDNAGNYTVLHEGGSDGEGIPDTEETPKPVVEYLQTVKHYKYKVITDTWEWFDTTTEKVKAGSNYVPAYIASPAGYYASHKDNGSTVSGPQTFSAYYRPNSYTLTFNAGGGSCETASKNVTYGGYYGTLPTPKRSGYTFTEWNTEEDGTGEKVSGGNIYDTASDGIIYAQWKPNVYTITLNGNGAETAGTEVYYEKYSTGNYTTKECTKTISTITKPVWTGYTFQGYYTETDSGGVCCIDGTGKITAANTAFTEDTILYVRWKANSYTITFHANGGSGTMDDMKLSYGEQENLPAAAFTKTGHKFKGWSTSANGGIVYEDREAVKNLTSAENGIIQLFALWEPVVYEIELDAQGAETAGTSVYYQKYDKGNYADEDGDITISTITKPVWPGHSFGGYYTEKDGKGTQHIDATGKILSTGTTFTSDIILYAKWTVNSYTIKYHANGGNGTMADQTVKYDETVALSSNCFTRTGYTFKGWAVTETGSVAYVDRASVKNLASENGKTINLYAVWEPVVYTITLDSDEGETAGTTAYYQKYDSGNYSDRDCTQSISSITKPTKTGYTFGGCYTGKDGTGTQYVDASGKILSGKTTFTDDITLYAKWTSNTYTLKYNANGGTGTMTDTPAVYGEFVTLRTNTFTRTGYQFMGWASSADGEVVYANSAMVKNVTPVDGAVVTLYAVWKPVVYKITFDAQNADENGTEYYYEKFETGNYSDSNCTTQISTITKPAKAGYIFKGYYTGKNGTGIQHVDETGKILATAKTFTEHTTLYAYWTPVTYTIMYHANGGTGTMAETSAVYDVSVTLAANLFDKTGHTFLGWSTSANGAVGYRDKAEVKNLTTVNGNSVTLYAVWDVNPYTVTYDYRTNGGNYVSEDVLSFDYGTAVDLTVTAKKDGYVFVGWNTDSTAVTAVTSLTMGTEPVTLYAIYKKDITVTFVEHGDSGTVIKTTTKTVYNNVTYADFLVKETANWTDWTNIGWTTETDGMADAVVSSGAAYTTDRSVTLYAKYRSGVVLRYDTNGSSMTLDAQTKERYYNAAGNYAYPSYVVADAPVLSGHSFVHWNLENGTVLDENGNPLTSVAPREEVTLTENSLLKAVWDRYPAIEAYNRHFTLEEARAEMITIEELLEKVTATDEEAKTASNPEGILENGTDVIVKNYSASDFTDVTGDKEIPVTYQATDSFGNVVTKTVTITITDTTVEKSPKKAYVRFINSSFLMDDAGNLVSPENGGLEETSIWRTNTAYTDLLRETLFNAKSDVEKKTVTAFGQSWEVVIAGSGEWAKKEETWIFTRSDIQEMKNFTRTYGHVFHALEKFFELFEGCKNDK